jgi:hypothetical protein
MYRPWPRGTLLAYLRNPTKRNLYRWLNIVSPSATYAPPERITWGTPSGGCACGQLCICGPVGAGPALGGQQVTSGRQEGGQGC